jgi:hypothetical protein
MDNQDDVRDEVHSENSGRRKRISGSISEESLNKGISGGLKVRHPCDTCNLRYPTKHTTSKS